MTTYRLLVAGRTVAQFDAAQVDYREGDEGGLHAMKIPGTYKVPDVTLKRGVIQDPAFANWLQGAKIKHDAVLQMIDSAGRPLASYPLGRCWVTKCTGPALAELEITAEKKK